jgi:hypothetical protein
VNFKYFVCLMCELSLTILCIYNFCLCDDENLMCNVLHECEFQLFFCVRIKIQCLTFTLCFACVNFKHFV